MSDAGIREEGSSKEASLQTNFVHQQEYGRIRKHPFTQSLAPHESAVTSNGLMDKEFSICLAPKSTTYLSNFMSDPDFVHEAAFVILSWVLKSYPSSLGIWPLAHPWFRVATLPFRVPYLLLVLPCYRLQGLVHHPETVRGWLSICKHGGAPEGGGDGEMDGMDGESFALGFQGTPPPEGDRGDGDSEQGEQDKGRG